GIGDHERDEGVVERGDGRRRHVLTPGLRTQRHRDAVAGSDCRGGWRRIRKRRDGRAEVSLDAGCEAARLHRRGDISAWLVVGINLARVVDVAAGVGYGPAGHETVRRRRYSGGARNGGRYTPREVRQVQSVVEYVGGIAVAATIWNIRAFRRAECDAGPA